MVLTFGQARALYEDAEGPARHDLAFWMFEAAMEDKKEAVDLAVLRAATQDACRFNTVALLERSEEEIAELVPRAMRVLMFLAVSADKWMGDEEYKECDEGIDRIYRTLREYKIERLLKASPAL